MVGSFRKWLKLAEEVTTPFHTCPEVPLVEAACLLGSEISHEPAFFFFNFF